MKELLKRWKELEPGWCEEMPNNSYLVGNISVDGDHVGYRVYPPFTEPHSLMRIQYAVQQAIAARGWYFDVAYLPLRPGDNKYDADIQVVGAYLQAVKADSPAGALLSAYVKALELGQVVGQGIERERESEPKERD